MLKKNPSHKNSNKYLKNIIRQFIRINQREEIKRSSQYILPKINTQIGCFIVLFENKKNYAFGLQVAMGRRKRKPASGDTCTATAKKLIKTCSTIETAKKLIKTGDFVWAKLP